MEPNASIYTTCNMLDSSRQERIEEILDASPVAQFKHIVLQSSKKKKCTRCHSVLVNFLLNNPDKCPLYFDFESGKDDLFSSSMVFRNEGIRIPLSGIDQGFSYIIFSMSSSTFSANELMEFKKLFIDLLLATDAFHGHAGESSMYVQRNELMRKSVDNVFELRSFPDFNRELHDVFWLNYFGPAYVDLWGENKVKKLAEKYNVEHFSNDAICVQTTPEVVLAKTGVSGIMDYEFKKHMYNVLGYNTFMHENQNPGKPGQYVPTLEDHRNLLKHIQSY